MVLIANAIRIVFYFTFGRRVVIVGFYNKVIIQVIALNKELKPFLKVKATSCFFFFIRKVLINTEALEMKMIAFKVIFSR